MALLENVGLQAGKRDAYVDSEEAGWVSALGAARLDLCILRQVTRPL